MPQQFDVCLALQETFCHCHCHVMSCHSNLILIGQIMMFLSWFEHNISHDV